MQEDLRRRSGDVEINVIERRIVEKTVAATDDRLSVAGKNATPLGRVREAGTRSKAAFARWQAWEYTHAKRQRRVEQWIGSRFIFNVEIIEEVCRLAVVRPGHTQIERKGLGHFPVIANIGKSIVFAEIERWIAVGNLHAVRSVGGKGTEIIEAERAIDQWQESIWGALERVIHAGFQLMSAKRVVPVVLSLPRVYNAPVILLTAVAMPPEGGTVPRLLPPKSTFRRVNPTRASLTMRWVMLWVQLTSTLWFKSGTLKGKPAAALFNPSSRLKRLLRWKM